MFTVLSWTRALFAILALAAFTLPVAAAPQTTSPLGRTTEASRAATHHGVPEPNPPAGSPELGILLIIGVIGFLIFMTWLLSRVSDDSSPPSDGSII
ncbi:MAG: hypothetical protein C0467_01535 [Planctomycetaceae bacterium]|nr:hypothetical protein [Planctomycetaceae bacterium]